MSEDPIRRKCCIALGVADHFHSPEHLRILKRARGASFFHRTISVLKSAGYDSNAAVTAAENLKSIYNP